MSSKRKTDFGKTNDHVLQGYLQHMFGVPPGRTVEDTLQTVASGEQQFPFDMGRAMVVYERLPVIPSVLSSKKGDLFDSVMSDMEPGSPVLWVDSYISGRDSLFVAASVSDDILGSEILHWINRMRTKEIMVGTLKSRTHVLACRMNCFSVK